MDEEVQHYGWICVDSDTLQRAVPPNVHRREPPLAADILSSRSLQHFMAASSETGAALHRWLAPYLKPHSVSDQGKLRII